MMKKRSRWLIPAVAAALLLTACGGPDQGESIKPPVTVTQSSTVTTSGPEVVIGEAELYHANGITVTATRLDKGTFGPSIRITASNESGKNLVISTKRLSVNGYMLPTSGLYCQVAAGKKANDELSLMTDELEQAGIETIAEVAFTLQISDADTYETIADSELITIKTSASGTFTQPADDRGRTVYQDKEIRVICRGLKQDAVWDGTVVFYLENNSAQPITIYAENVSINGYMVDVSLWADLRANTRAVDGMYILSLDELEIDSIEGVNTIEFTLRIIHGDTWEEIDSTAPITLNFE